MAAKCHGRRGGGDFGSGGDRTERQRNRGAASRWGSPRSDARSFQSRRCTMPGPPCTLSSGFRVVPPPSLPPGWARLGNFLSTRRERWARAEGMLRAAAMTFARSQMESAKPDPERRAARISGSGIVARDRYLLSEGFEEWANILERSQCIVEVRAGRWSGKCVSHRLPQALKSGTSQSTSTRRGSRAFAVRERARLCLTGNDLHRVQIDAHLNRVLVHDRLKCSAI